MLFYWLVSISLGNIAQKYLLRDEKEKQKLYIKDAIGAMIGVLVAD